MSAKQGPAVGLTDAKIAGLKPSAERPEFADQVVSGLRVRVGASGPPTFILRKRVGGVLVNLTLGRYGPRFQLRDARKKARDILVDIESGRPAKSSHPRQRKGGPAAETVRALVEVYLETEVRGRKRSAAEIERTLTKYVLPVIGDRMADSVTRGDITKLIDGVMNANPAKPVRMMARLVFAQTSAFYSWAMPRLDRLPSNPCRDAARPPPVKARERVLSDAEVRAFWQACEAMAWPFKPGFRLLLLTGARRSEVFDAERTEFAPGVWTLPSDRAKNGNTHLVPLANEVRRIIDGLPVVVGNPLLLPSVRDGVPVRDFTHAKERLDRLMAQALEVDAVEPWVLHDLRRTAATGMQRLGFPLPVVEAALNHVSGSRSGIVGVYQRHDYADEKRAALEAWAAEVERIIAPEVEVEPLPSNVIPLRRAR